MESPCSDLVAAGVGVSFQVFPWLLWLEVLTIMKALGVGSGGRRGLYWLVFLAHHRGLEWSKKSWTGFLLNKRPADMECHRVSSDYPDCFCGVNHHSWWLFTNPWHLWNATFLFWIHKHVCHPSQRGPSWKEMSTCSDHQQWLWPVSVIASIFSTIRVLVLQFRDHPHAKYGCLGLLREWVLGIWLTNKGGFWCPCPESE